MTKSEITKIFSKLREYGYLVAHFTDNRRGTKGNNGFPDIHIVGKGKIYYIEVKIGKDTFSPDQLKYQEVLQRVNVYTDRVKYLVVTEKNAQQIADDILQMYI